MDAELRTKMGLFALTNASIIGSQILVAQSLWGNNKRRRS